MNLVGFKLFSKIDENKQTFLISTYRVMEFFH